MVFKHTFDRLFAFVLLVTLLPVLLCSALAVRLTSRGPVLFRQRRVGRDGELFDLYKFRSMRMGPPQSRTLNDDDSTAIVFLLGGDTTPGGIEGEGRNTFVGRILRHTSIDELPQVLNVLRGEMSFIGPRPERPEFVELLKHDVMRYDNRHRVKSGITGWAQVHGLRGRTSLAERVEWDNYYIAHWSLALDLKIALLTIFALFHKDE
jgi:lipopolysaccharide/colanic/teichoic acid biosynthesis glycosyltransferase